MGENRVWIEDGQKAPPPDKPEPARKPEDGDFATPKQDAPTEDDKPLE
jgi:hypothetical protein